MERIEGAPKSGKYKPKGTPFDPTWKGASKHLRTMFQRSALIMRHKKNASVMEDFADGNVGQKFILLIKHQMYAGRMMVDKWEPITFENATSIKGGISAITEQVPKGGKLSASVTNLLSQMAIERSRVDAMVTGNFKDLALEYWDGGAGFDNMCTFVATAYSAASDVLRLVLE